MIICACYKLLYHSNYFQIGYEASVEQGDIHCKFQDFYTPAYILYAYTYTLLRKYAKNTQWTIKGTYDISIQNQTPTPPIF